MGGKGENEKKEKIPHCHDVEVKSKRSADLLSKKWKCIYKQIILFILCVIKS